MSRVTRLLVGVLMGVVAVALPPNVAGAEPADGFQDSLVATISTPTALAFTPDGRLLVASQRGVIWVVDGQGSTPIPALDITSKTCSEIDEGLLGLTVDPNFSTEPYVYISYTFNRSGDCSLEAPIRKVNRVSRFTMVDDSIDPESELVLIDNVPSPTHIHGPADVAFGDDGYLYISLGDGGCDYRGDSGCQPLNDAARDLGALTGKILRITRDGGLPSDNPFIGPNSVRCNQSGGAQIGQVCSEIFAFGLRNPFRITFSPLGDNRFFINDVGLATWEEIDLGQRGADYGWNVREGACENGITEFSHSNCGEPPGMTNPIHAYDHDIDCTAITGGAFVPKGVWPASYDDTYLFSDLTCRKIFQLHEFPGGTSQSELFATHDFLPIDLAFGPFGETQALYYAAYPDQIRAITYVGDANRSPFAVASADPVAGDYPLTVHFDASLSTDPDSDELSFDWDFGDGSPHGTGPSPDHVYEEPGTYMATVQVSDPQGATDTRTIRIDPGNNAPVPVISSPGEGARYQLGQQITLDGSASDKEDGDLADESLVWKVVLHHNTHTHTYMPDKIGNHITFTAPYHDENSATSKVWLEVQLTAIDSGGVVGYTSRELHPVPGTEITEGPDEVTPSQEADFEFITKDSKATYECSFDLGPWEACTSPTHYSDVSEGPHSFSVRATDGEGVTDRDPVTRSWTVDLTPPDTTITAGPSATANSRQADLAFGSDDPAATYECSLDGALWTLCTSPVHYDNLSESSHTFQVRATDAVGNVDPAPEQRTWTVDVTPPDTTITAGPTGFVTTRSAEFRFVSPGETDAAYRCALDDAPWGPCTSPQVYSNLPEGQHSFRVTARDVAGNLDASPATRTWTIDLTPPDTSVTSGPSGPTASKDADFTFTSGDAVAFECSLDDGPWTSCISPRHYSNLSESHHTFEVRAIDAAGHIDQTPGSRSWTVDVTAPSVPSLTVGSNEPFQLSEGFLVSWAGEGDTFDVRYEDRVWDGTLLSEGTPKTNSPDREMEFSGDPGHSYCFEARANDEAGNRSQWSPASCTTLPLDDTSLQPIGTRRAREAWSRESGDGYYFGTSTVTSSHGAKLRFPDAGGAKRMAIVLERCPGCGRLEVSLRSGGSNEYLRIINLASSVREMKRFWLHLPDHDGLPEGSSLVLKVISRDRPVRVDALAIDD